MSNGKRGAGTLSVLSTIMTALFSIGAIAATYLIWGTDLILPNIDVLGFIEKAEKDSVSSAIAQQEGVLTDYLNILVLCGKIFSTIVIASASLFYIQWKLHKGDRETHEGIATKFQEAISNLNKFKGTVAGELNKSFESLSKDLKSNIDTLNDQGKQILPFTNESDTAKHIFYMETRSFKFPSEKEEYDRTVDVVKQYRFQDLILWNRYLMYFFQRKSRSKDPVRIVVLDQASTDSAIYCALSTLAGYRTFVVTERKYKEIIEFFVSKKNLTWSDRRNLEDAAYGNPAISINKNEDGSESIVKADYNDDRENTYGTISSSISEILKEALIKCETIGEEIVDTEHISSDTLNDVLKAVDARGQVA